MDAILELIGMIYDGAVDASRWQPFLDACVEAMGGRHGFLVLNSGRRNGPPLLRWSNWPDEDARLYIERFMADDLYRIIGNSQPEGVIRPIDGLSPDEVLGQSAAYREFFALRGIRYRLMGFFLRTADGSSAIAAGRRQQDGPFGDQATAMLRSLMPHLRRAVLLQSELSSLRAQLATLTRYLDRHPYPFLLTDAQGRVIYANASAKETAGLKDGLAITSGHLSLMSHGSQAAFLRALSEVATGQGAPLRRFDVERPSLRPAYRLLLIPLPYSHEIPPGMSQAVAAVLIIGREPGPELDPAILRELFSLTPAEARVTGKLGAGRSAEQVAEDMGVSVGTVRTHIRHILSKTATGRQGELISLVLRMALFRAVP